jgi:hypothetical protein
MLPAPPRHVAVETDHEKIGAVKASHWRQGSPCRDNRPG